MAHSNKFDTILDLIMKNDFEATENVSEDLKCVLCKKILMNAYQSPCGCSFCQKCVDEFLQKSEQKLCPGKSKECKEQILKNLQMDYKTNKRVQKLVVKCPEKTCLYECKLSNMDTHLRLCSKKSVKCPYYELGCDEVAISTDKVIDHIQSEIYNHNSMIFGINNQMKQSIEMLAHHEEIHDENITFLKNSMKDKETQIETLKKEVAILTNQINEKVDQNALTLNTILIEMSKDFDQKLKQAIYSVNESNEKYRKEILLRFNDPGKFLDEQFDSVAGSILWSIEKINKCRKKGGSVESEYFYLGYNKYKMRLLLYANGTGNVTGTGLSIYLYIYPCTKHSKVDWPFKGFVTIKVLNKLNPFASVKQSKHCIIDNFEEDLDDEEGSLFMDDSIDSCNYHWDNQFDFLYNTLSDSGILDNNIITVECNVEIK